MGVAPSQLVAELFDGILRTRSRRALRMRSRRASLWTLSIQDIDDDAVARQTEGAEANLAPNEHPNARCGVAVFGPGINHTRSKAFQETRELDPRWAVKRDDKLVAAQCDLMADRDRPIEHDPLEILMRAGTHLDQGGRAAGLLRVADRLVRRALAAGSQQLGSAWLLARRRALGQICMGEDQRDILELWLGRPGFVACRCRRRRLGACGRSEIRGHPLGRADEARIDLIAEQVARPDLLFDVGRGCGRAVGFRRACCRGAGVTRCCRARFVRRPEDERGSGDREHDAECDTELPRQRERRGDAAWHGNLGRLRDACTGRVRSAGFGHREEAHDR